MFDYLLEDNKSCQLSISFRLEIEKIALNSNNQIIIDQIRSCNLIRLVSESSYFSKLSYPLDKLKYLAQVISSAYESLQPSLKAHLFSFIQLNFVKFNITNRKELSKIKLFNFPAGSNKRKETSSESMVDSTPSSPPPSSSLVNTLNYSLFLVFFESFFISPIFILAFSFFLYR